MRPHFSIVCSALVIEHHPLSPHYGLQRLTWEYVCRTEVIRGILKKKAGVVNFIAVYYTKMQASTKCCIPVYEVHFAIYHICLDYLIKVMNSVYRRTDFQN